MYTYDDLINDPHWFIFNVKMKISTFFNKFKSVSEYYRKISNSTSVLFGRTNREFFKVVNEGFYRSSIEDNDITIIFFFRFSDLSRIFNLLRDLSLRIKKIQYCDVEVHSIDLIQLTDRNLLETSGGINFYQRIKGLYVNPLHKPLHTSKNNI